MSATRFALALATISLFANCSTTYDVYGRPVQSVDPGVAVAGAAAAGLIGYALAQDQARDQRYHSTTYHHRHVYHTTPHYEYSWYDDYDGYGW